MMNKMSSITFPDGSNYEVTDDKARKDIVEINNNVSDMQGAIDEVSRTIGYTVSKNLLCLDNAKGASGAETVTRSGDSLTIKANMSLNTYLCEFGTHKLKKGTYILSCKSTNYISDGSKCGWRIYKDGAWGEIAYSDTYEFTLDADKDINIAYYLSVNNDVSVGTSVTLTELMLREASEDGTYVPYVPSVKSLIYDVKKIHVNKTIMTSTTNQGIWDYTATRKCLLNLTATAGHYGGRPVDLRAYVNGESFSWVRNHEASNNIGSSLTIPISLVMEKGESMFISVAYTNETQNTIYVEGYVQYLE